MTMKLLYNPESCLLATHAALEESGLPFEFERVDLAAGVNQQPAFLAKNRWGRVPALEVDGTILTENVAILPFIADRVPDRALLPIAGPGSAGRGRRGRPCRAQPHAGYASRTARTGRPRAGRVLQLRRPLFIRLSDLDGTADAGSTAGSSAPAGSRAPAARNASIGSTRHGGGRVGHGGSLKDGQHQDFEWRICATWRGKIAH